MKKKGHVGNDIHKNEKPEIPESGGISIVVGLIVASVLSMIFFPVFLNILIIFLLTIILTGIIGFMDDYIKLRSRYKILLTIFTGLIIFIAIYIEFITISSPTLPFLGTTRLTLIYPLLIPIIVAIFANTVNMLEGYNGEGSGTCLIAVCFLFVCALIWNSAEALILTIMAIAVLIPFFHFNKYPSKIFPGDIGTLSMGVLIACIAIFGSLEVPTLCVLLIHVFNSFYVIFSLRGFFESSEIQIIKADIILLEDNRIKASSVKGAALTLPRLILAKGPLSERELVLNFYAISIICGFFAIITTLLMVYTSGILNLLFIFFCILIFFIPTLIILKNFDRIKGIIVLMVIMLICAFLYFLFVDLFIMKLNFADIDLLNIKVPVNILLSFIIIIPGLILWYFITIKYFWIQINKIKKENHEMNSV